MSYEHLTSIQMENPAPSVPKVIPSLAIIQQFNSTQMIFMEDLPCSCAALDLEKQRSMSQQQPAVEN